MKAFSDINSKVLLKHLPKLCDPEMVEDVFNFSLQSLANFWRENGCDVSLIGDDVESIKILAQNDQKFENIFKSNFKYLVR